MLYALDLFFSLYIVLHRRYFQYFVRYGAGLYTAILQRGGRIRSSKNNIVIYDEMGKAAHSRVGRLLSLGDLDGVQGRGCLNNAREKIHATV